MARPLQSQDLDSDMEFQHGEIYERMALHDTFGGNRQKGIANTRSHPFIFVFNLESGDKYGYEDEFISSDRFLYTGQGREDDQEMIRENRKLRDHASEGNALHLFEEVTHFDSPNDRTVVTYLGEFRYEDHHIERLPDRNGNKRDAFRFVLERVDDEMQSEIEVTDQSPADLLRQLAQQQTGNQSTERVRSRPLRSDAVKQFALSVADGVCQGCGEPAPFVDADDEPFMEVHHLTRRSDGGPDRPSNVIALCPNCHRRVHYGKDGAEFNNQLIEQVAERTERLREMT